MYCKFKQKYKQESPWTHKIVKLSSHENKFDYSLHISYIKLYLYITSAILPVKTFAIFILTKDIYQIVTNQNFVPEPSDHDWTSMIACYLVFCRSNNFISKAISWYFMDKYSFHFSIKTRNLCLCTCCSVFAYYRVICPYR